MLSTPNFEAAVRRAVARSNALDGSLASIVDHARDAVPAELASAAEKRDRRRFLESLYDERGEADAAFERIILGNELQDASFLARGSLVARTVMRVVLQAPGGATRGYGTGFLVGNGLLITNNHVIARPDQAANALVEAFYERDVYGSDMVPWRFALDPSVFFTSPADELDFTVVGVAPRSLDGGNQLDSLGWLPLIGGSGKATEGEWLTIIQHPAGERKQLCVRENKLLKRDTDVLWYMTDTLGGSSGSPVFNNDWLLVALHHSGVPEIKNGKWQTQSGQDYDSGRHSEADIKWIANEGIRVSRIVETLRTDPRAIADPRLQSVVSTDVTDLRARLPVLYKPELGPVANLALLGQTPTTGPGTGPAAPPPQPGPASTEDNDMAEKLVTVTLAVDDDGSVRVVGQDGAGESFALEAKKKAETVHAPAKPREDWVGGFEPDFLGKDDLRVNLPVVKKGPVAYVLDAQGQRSTSELNAMNAKQPFTPRRDFLGNAIDPERGEKGILDYNGFSAIMHPDRRLAYFVAANIDGSHPFELGRPDADWLIDERILESQQLNDSFYSGTLFDRGHLCRREDMEWGENKFVATRRANGTFVHTNCAPQFWKFNRQKGNKSKGLLLWQGIETFLLEKIARTAKFKLQVISGPIFGEFDRKFREVAIPFDYWKIAVAVTEKDELFATAFVLSQKTFVEDGDLIRPKEATVQEMFAEYELYQRPIEEIERRTGLAFTYGSGAKSKALAKVDRFADELAKPAWERGSVRRRSGPLEAMSLNADGKIGTGPLESLGEVFLPAEV